MANKSIGVVYNWLHHLIPDSPWEPTKINQPRLERMNKPSQTKSFFVEQEQYIGEMGKLDQHLSFLPELKEDKIFQKKQD